mgnify:CR=1 FL=1
MSNRRKFLGSLIGVSLGSIAIARRFQPLLALDIGEESSEISPLASFNSEKARDSWMSGKYRGDEAGAHAWAIANGINYQGGDKVVLPNGATVDILGNFSQRPALGPVTLTRLQASPPLH